MSSAKLIRSTLGAGALALLGAAPALMLPACGGSRTEVSNNSTTTGRELQDLDDAHKKGLISDDEYKKQRKRILSGNS
jgi:hypothetical protein